MNPDPAPSTMTRLGRALRHRCPHCGTKAFSSYFVLYQHCRGCGLRFERDQGYWVGAVIVNTTLVFASFLLVFVGGMVLTWPEVPWTALLVVTIAINAVLPVALYPLSKTIWMAMEHSWHPPEPNEFEAATQRL